MDKAPDKYKVICVYAVLALSTIAVYWQVWHHEFINFDDNLYVYNNSHVKAGLKGEGLLWAFTKAHAYNWHPLTWISHMLDCQFYGLLPGAHHFTNVLFHTANALLLLLLLDRMTGGSFWSSAFVAALFALHPLHVESVAWLSERKDVLSTFFWILTTLAYVRYVEHTSPARYLTMLVLFAFGLMAKQMLVTLPFVLLLLDYWPLRRFTLGKHSSAGSQPRAAPVPIRLCILEKLPLLVLSAVAGVIVFRIQQGTLVMKSITEYSLPCRAGNALVAYAVYIGQMLWPRHLAILYPHPGNNLPLWQVAASALFLVAITAGVIWKIRQRPYLGVGWLWYLGTLLPVIGLVQVGLQARADRYTYIPLTGLFIIIAWAAPDLLARLPHRRVVLSLSATIILSVLGIVTWRQVGHWHDSITLYRHATVAVPNNSWAYLRLGQTLFAQGKADEAITNFARALQIEPDFLEPRCDLARALTDQDRLDEALVHYTKALQFKPDFAPAHSGMAEVLIQQGKPEQAAFHYRQALRTQPRNPTIHNGLGTALAMQGELDQAIIHFNNALQLKPDYHQAHANLGAALAQQRKFDDALAHLNEALRINPRSSKALTNIGVLFFEQGKVEEAIASFTSALQIEPNNPQARRYLAAALKHRDESPEPKDAANQQK
jgi:tetratricopeptide (TPR) repeat protein